MEFEGYEIKVEMKEFIFEFWYEEIIRVECFVLNRIIFFVCLDIREWFF